jgi:hypothetical protein
MIQLNLTKFCLPVSDFEPTIVGLNLVNHDLWEYDFLPLGVEPSWFGWFYPCDGWE